MLRLSRRKKTKVIAALSLSTILLFSSTAMAVSPSLRIGSTGTEVNRVQEKLKTLGYFKHNQTTNYFGPVTRNAVIQFQASKGLAQDGVVGVHTMSVLIESSINRVEVSRGSNSSLTSLKRGDRGQEVTDLQGVLKNKGFYNGPLDGDFGPATESAVKQFQKFAGLHADGVVGSQTFQRLNAVFELLRQGSSGDAVSYVQQVLKNSGFYTGNIDGEFGPGTANAVRAYQKSNGILADGIVGATTMARMQSSVTSRGGSISFSSQKVERLSWSTVNTIWSRDFGYATIVDYKTGKSFRVVRTAGTNHADVETASAADTAIMKQIFGGSFSWERRAVIVEVNGRRLAASMAGMPHAGRDDRPFNTTVTNRSGGYGTGNNMDGIKGNNMDGVFDVHFLGSRTHGTNRVDSLHQTQIMKIALN